ncbi:hypothetical protein KY359_04805 [Candidatus Woesearchaeota archaeon]|nr:hypothetical protein [Candidatus Woesearchaeota archaeon]
MSRANPPKKLVLSRKAQDAASAATLIAVIALLIVFYLLFIPPSFRDQILEGNESTSTGKTGTAGRVNETILKASPGTLSRISSEEMEHNIPSVVLYSKKESKVLDTIASLSVKSSVFGKKTAAMQFTIDDLDNTDNLLLTFIDKKMKGGLLIKANGNEVFSGDVTQENPEPVRINKKFLVRGNNNIEFEAEPVGWKFWRVNRHNMQNLQISGEVKDISQQMSRNIFIVSATEKSNVKRAILRFTPDCMTGKTGKLNVLINQHSVYYSVPDCGGRIAIEFTPDVLREGENTIVFDSEEGNYLIDLIRITSELKEVLQPAYYFEISEDTMDDVRDGKYTVWLKMTFTEDNDQKAGALNINGRETSIFQRERTYSKNINDYIIEGNNAIKIIPETTLEIVSMEVVKE